MTADEQTEWFKLISSAIHKVNQFDELADEGFISAHPEARLIIQGTLYNLSALRQMIADKV